MRTLTDEQIRALAVAARSAQAQRRRHDAEFKATWGDTIRQVVRATERIYAEPESPDETDGDQLLELDDTTGDAFSVRAWEANTRVHLLCKDKREDRLRDAYLTRDDALRLRDALTRFLDRT